MRSQDPLTLARFVAPSDIAQSLNQLAERLRAARLRRNMTVEQVADLLRVNRGTVADAEHGKPSTSVSVYVGLFWALGIPEQLDELATLEREHEELVDDTKRRRARVPRKKSVP